MRCSSVHWLELVFQERFGYQFEVTLKPESIALAVSGQDKKVEFDKLQAVFHESTSDFPCKQWRASSEGFTSPIEDPIPAPSKSELRTPLVEMHEKGAIIHYDIPGLIYWMLTRREEIGRADLDNHQRFPAVASHAYRNNYLERPIVDEWLNILGQVIQRVWPCLPLKQNYFEVTISHDVDGPARYAFQDMKGLIRSMSGDVLLRRDIISAFNAPWIWLNSKHTIHPKDPDNTFDWLMQQSESNGLTSAFYFICGRTDASKDALYDPEMPQIRKLIREIHQRGHEIGLHPSYNTYDRPEEIAREADRLRRVCAEEGAEQTEWGGRMHFLRWDQAVTLKAWADAGMAYDSTLGYADRPGFRCGTCYEYPAFDALNDKLLSLRVRPLVAMDCTVMAKRYLGLGSTEAAYEKFNKLKDNCRKVGGTFTLLWHNSFFSSPKDFDIYHRLISER